jgi:zinc protease
VATRPDFPESEIERARQELLTEFLQARQDPSGLMALAFPSVLFPPEHRYASLNMGSESSLRSLQRSQLVAFHTAHYRPEDSLLIVVGDVDPSSLHGQLEEFFGGWTATGSGEPDSPLTAAPQIKGRRVAVVDRPGAAQTMIRIARLGVARSTPDYYPLTVMNTVLGGSFTSRLNQNLREEHGYTYGASSAFDMRHQPGPFYAAANVQTDKTGAALVEFFKELAAIREPLSASELSKTKNYLAYGYPARFLSVGQLAAQLENQWVYGLPESSLVDYVPRIQAVTAEEVARVAQAYVVPEEMVIVMVGDWRQIEPQLEGLDLGPVEFLTP